MRIACHAVLRAACWPIETADHFAAPALVGSAAQTRTAASAVADEREPLDQLLTDAVPLTANRTWRAWLLEVRRLAWRGDGPLPAAPGPGQPSPTEHPLVHEAARAVARASASRAALAEQRAAFAVAHATELARQRERLRELTSEDRFLRALTLADPDLARRWRRSPPPGAPGSDKSRVRRLEAAVYHYLMRAAGRATPHGAWAGVALVEPAEGPSPGLHISADAGAWRAVVNLMPFVVALDALSRQPRYLESFPLFLDPMARRTDAGWRYERGDLPSDERFGLLPTDSLADVLAEAYRTGGARPAGPLLDALASQPGADPRLRPALGLSLRALRHAGVLRADIAPPFVGCDAWTALDRMGRRLLPDDAAHWSERVEGCRRVCARLGGAFDTLSPDELAELLGALEAEVATLWSWAGIAEPPPRRLARVDHRLPFRASWDDALRSAVGRAVTGFLGLHGVAGTAEEYRRASLEEAAILCGSRPTALAELLGEATGSRAASSRLFALSADGVVDEAVLGPGSLFEDVLGPHAADRTAVWPAPPTASPTAGPWGSMLVVPTGGAGLRVERGRPEAGFFLQRFAELLSTGPLSASGSDAPGPGTPPLVELVSADVADFGVALRPDVVTRAFDPHGPGELAPADVELHFDADRRPWLVNGDQARPSVLTYGATARLGDADCCTRTLAVVACGHGWEFVSYGLPLLSAEVHAWHHLPRVVLEGGAEVSAERWTLPATVLDALRDRPGDQAYLDWRAEVDRRGIPLLVWARTGARPDAPGVLLRTDSPLGLEHLLRLARPGTERVVLWEPPDEIDGWPVVDEDGGHHVAELGVTWYDDDYWATVRPQGTVPVPVITHG